MSSSFDPLHVWLGIPPAEQPPHHYRLLGLALFESNPTVIVLAAQRQMTHVKSFACTEYGPLSQEILNQLARAKACLLNGSRKAEYDRTLRAELRARAQRRAATRAHTGAPAGVPDAKARPAPLLPSVPSAANEDDQSAGRAWLIGAGAGCQWIVDEPTVSGRHCRLRQTLQGFILEDLNSTNGTYVNGRRIAAPALIGADDIVHLGRRVVLPWPRDSGLASPRALTIGSDPASDIVLDWPCVSRRHGRLFVEGRRLIVEDLGSANGIALNEPHARVTRGELAVDDTVFFGSIGKPLVELLAARRR